MKTKLFFLTVVLLIAGKNLAQSSRAYYVMDKLKQLNGFFQQPVNRHPAGTGYTLDSIVHQNYDAGTSSYVISTHDVYSYDNDFHNTEWIAGLWNGNAYDQNYKEEYFYTNDGKISEINVYSDQNGTLAPVSKAIYNYNNDGQLSEMIVQNYNNGQFENDEKLEFSYNQSTDVYPNQILAYEWSGGNWQYLGKVDITYSTSGYGYTEMIFYQYNNNSWEKTMKFVRTYDSNGRLTEELHKVWAANVWIDVEKKLLTYNTQNGNLETTVETYDLTSGSPSIQNRIFFVLDAQQNLLQEDRYRLDNSGQNLIGDTRQVYAYNQNDVVMEKFNWDTQSGDWETDSLYKEIYTYDMSIDKNDLILPFRESNQLFDVGSLFDDDPVPDYDIYHHKITSKETFNRASASGNWESDKKSLFYYDQVTAVEEYNLIPVKVFPNPFNDNIRFEVEAEEFDVNIYGLDGKLLYQNKQRNDEDINLGFLNIGIYIYKIKTDKGIATGQVIKN